MDKVSNNLGKACSMVGKFEGLKPITTGVYSKNPEIVVQGRAVDAYLLVAVLAERIQAGDIVIHDVGDKAGKKEYFDKLISSVDKIDA